MIYAETDFFLALLKPKDWLKKPAAKMLRSHQGRLWTSPITLIELLLLSSRYGLNSQRLLSDVLKIAALKDADPMPFFIAAEVIDAKKAGVFDALHAAHCGTGNKIISSDKVFDRLGLDRIPLAV